MAYSKGGEDSLSAEGDGNFLVGYAIGMFESTGGDDSLTSNDGNNILYGDA